MRLILIISVSGTWPGKSEHCVPPHVSCDQYTYACRLGHSTALNSNFVVHNQFHTIGSLIKVIVCQICGRRTNFFSLISHPSQYRNQRSSPQRHHVMIAFALTVFVSLLVESQAQTVQPLTVRPRKFSTTKTVRQSACVDAVRRAFTGYRKYAWGHDNLKPISMTFTDPYSLAFTILDMMDTLLIMNMRTGELFSNWIVLTSN